VHHRVGDTLHGLSREEESRFLTRGQTVHQNSGAQMKSRRQRAQGGEGHLSISSLHRREIGPRDARASRELFLSQLALEAPESEYFIEG
jgi:hypothetical protein